MSKATDKSASDKSPSASPCTFQSDNWVYESAMDLSSHQSLSKPWKSSAWFTNISETNLYCTPSQPSPSTPVQLQKLQCKDFTNSNSEVTPTLTPHPLIKIHQLLSTNYKIKVKYTDYKKEPATTQCSMIICWNVSACFSLDKNQTQR